MNEKDIIKNLKEIKKIKPQKDWVLLAKKDILGEEPSFSFLSVLSDKTKDFFNSFVLVHKFASVSLLFAVSFTGVAVYSQNSLPGDSLYSIKRITEKAQFSLKAEDKSVLSFEVAQRRLDELDRVIKTNSSRNLAPAINEFQATVSETSKKVEVAKVKDIEKASKEIKKIEERKAVIQSLGIEIGENKEFDDLKENITCRRTEELINFTETRTLTEEQKRLFESAKESFKEGKCLEAGEKILVDFEKVDKKDNIDESIEEGEEGEEGEKSEESINKEEDKNPEEENSEKVEN